MKRTPESYVIRISLGERRPACYLPLPVYDPDMRLLAYVRQRT